jgi:hypothetical protein
MTLAVLPQLEKVRNLICTFFIVSFFVKVNLLLEVKRETCVCTTSWTWEQRLIFLVLEVSFLSWAFHFYALRTWVDPVIGVDVSENGKWILATTTRYLLLINSEVEGQSSNGFNKSMGTKKVLSYIQSRVFFTLKTIWCSPSQRDFNWSQNMSP